MNFIKYFKIAGVFALFFSFQTSASVSDRKIATTIKSEIGKETVTRADSFIDALPVTVVASSCPRSKGGIHDFYSEGDYWWPDPKNPDGPYIRRDGESNPNNFSDHRLAMIRLGDIVASLTSAYLITGNMKYARAVERHILDWFIKPDTKMNPSLNYAQAIKGVATGRGIGIIDTVHLIEVAQSLIRLNEKGAIDPTVFEGAKKWFAEYLDWMCTHPYGKKEMKAANNHGTCWALQAAAFAKLTDNDKILTFCREKYKNVFLPKQMAADGSFPLELARTKPYGYSLFNLDAMAGLCQILSSPTDNLWSYSTEDGKSISKGVEFILPYIMDKDGWPFGRDVAHWDEWPVAQPTLIFFWAQTGNRKCIKQWKRLDHFPTGQEVVRNLPIRNPAIWLL